MQIEEIKDQICDVCHKMWQLGWVAANDGNVSVRLEDGTFLATPTGMSKSFITPDKLLRIDAKGNVLEGAEGLRPSSEIKMHLRCYEKRADVNAVVHAHPPAATGFAVAHRPMDMYNMIEDVAAIGAVPLTPYGTPSTTEVPDAIEPYLNDHDVMLLENHGALTVGSDVITAYYRMESLELWAKITINAIILGGSYDIDRKNISMCISSSTPCGFTKSRFVYPIAEIAEMLDKGCTTIKGALNELDAAGLLERRRTGFSAANRLYVKVPPIPVVQFSDQLTDGKPPLIRAGNRPTDSRKTDLMTVGKPSPNQTNINNLIESQTKGASEGQPPAAYGRYKNVFLSDTELLELEQDFPGKWEYYLDRLSCHIASTGKQYQSHAATIYKWAQEDAAKEKPKKGIPDYSFKEGESL